MLNLLRDYQQSAVDKCLQDLKSHSKIGLVLPTGAGKTVCFIEIAKRFLEENPAKSVLVLSHLSILTQQTYERFKQFAPELFVGIMQANKKPGEFDQVVIGTMQTLCKEKKASLLNKRIMRKVGLIIVDEAHYLSTKSYDKCLSYFDGAKVLGCTATPIRKNKFMSNFFEKISDSISLGELIEMGHLVRPNLIQIQRDSSDIADIMAITLKTYIERENGKNAIIFMKSVEDAKTIRNVFQDAGVPTECLSFDMPKELRDEYIKRFTRRDLKVLTCCEILSAGFDSPTVQSCFMPFGTGSVTRYLQRVGRGLRPDIESGKRSCNIYIYGPEPRIKSGFYERINNIALKRNGKIKEHSTYLEDYELNDYEPNSIKYEYTQLVVDTLNKMKILDLPNLEKMLNQKEFPKRFMDKLAIFKDRLPANPVCRKSDMQPSEKQKALLINYDFTKSQVDALSRYEAATMISAILGNSQNSEYVITSGKFKNYHVSQLPWTYRKVVLEKFSGSSLAALIRSWENRTKSA